MSQPPTPPGSPGQPLPQPQPQSWPPQGMQLPSDRGVDPDGPATDAASTPTDASVPPGTPPPSDPGSIAGWTPPPWTAGPDAPPVGRPMPQYQPATAPTSTNHSADIPYSARGSPGFPILPIVQAKTALPRYGYVFGPTNLRLELGPIWQPVSTCGVLGRGFLEHGRAKHVGNVVEAVMVEVFVAAVRGVSRVLRRERRVQPRLRLW
jgi:hypothetical protein